MVHIHEEEYVEEPTEDISEEIDATEGDALGKIQELKAKLKDCEKERKEYLEGWQRSKADYLNSKRRYDEERVVVASRAEDALIEKILPLCDSFDMAAAHVGEGDAWATGWNQIHTQLRSLLTSFEVTAINPLGESFNPHLHEALKTEPVEEEGQHDHVIAVLQKGYMRRDRLIRPAKVVIGEKVN